VCVCGLPSAAQVPAAVQEEMQWWSLAARADIPGLRSSSSRGCSLISDPRLPTKRAPPVFAVGVKEERSGAPALGLVSVTDLTDVGWEHGGGGGGGRPGRHTKAGGGICKSKGAICE
jgi:hypothetical protein